MAVHPPQVHRGSGGGAGEQGVGGKGGAPEILVPAAPANPGARGPPGCARSDECHERVIGGNPAQVERGEDEAQVPQVRVRVDEAGVQRPSACIEPDGGWPGKRCSLGVRADEQDAVAGHRERFGPWSRGVSCVDAGVGDEEVGWAGLGREAGCRENCEGNTRQGGARSQSHQIRLPRSLFPRPATAGPVRPAPAPRRMPCPATCGRRRRRASPGPRRGSGLAGRPGTGHSTCMTAVTWPDSRPKNSASMPQLTWHDGYSLEPGSPASAHSMASSASTASPSGGRQRTPAHLGEEARQYLAQEGLVEVTRVVEPVGLLQPGRHRLRRARRRPRTLPPAGTAPSAPPPRVRGWREAAGRRAGRCRRNGWKRGSWVHGMLSGSLRRAPDAAQEFRLVETSTPSFCALSSLLPASSPATTMLVFLLTLGRSVRRPLDQARWLRPAQAREACRSARS